MKTIKEEIASNLLFYRKRANLTQRELAEQLGIKHNSVSAWENGTNSIDVEILFKICEILDVSVTDMYGAYSRVTKFTFTPIEIDFISKFRKLDERGKRAVLDTLDREYTYIEKAHPLSEQMGMDDLVKSYKYTKQQYAKAKSSLAISDKDIAEAISTHAENDAKEYIKNNSKVKAVE